MTTNAPEPAPQSHSPDRPPRLTMQYVFSEAWRQFVEIDTPMLRTLVGLLYKPGVVIRGYLGDDRKRYTSPLKIAVYAGGLYVLLAIWLLPHSSVDPSAPQFASSANPEAMARAAELGSTTSHFTSIFAIPVLAISNWLLFRKPRFTLAEHHAVSFAAIGGVFVYACLLVPILFLLPHTGNARPTAVGIINVVTLFVYAPLCMWTTYGQRWFAALPLGLVSCVVFVVGVQLIQSAAIFGAYAWFSRMG